MTIAACVLFVATLVLVIWQPRGLSIGWSAAGGAALALLIGVVTWKDVATVTSIVGDATVAFVGIIVYSSVLDRVGFFEWAALKMAHAARGNGVRVFVYILILGGIVSAFFSNDGAALILTPIVLEKMKVLRFNRQSMLAFLFAGGFIADTTSLPLVVSNLVNIVSADYFHIGFVRYFLHMVIPDLVSFLASTGVLYLFFHHQIPKHYDPSALKSPRAAIKHDGMFRISWLLLVLLIIGYPLTQVLRLPLSIVATAVAALFLVFGQGTRVIDAKRVIREAPWSIVVFSTGMYVVVYGLRNVGLTAWLGQGLAHAAQSSVYAGILATGFLAAGLSSVMNNLPSTMIGALAVHAALHSIVASPIHHPSVYQSLVYANVIGCDLGPKITPLGSLATLLWLHILKRQGISITWGQYFRVGFVLTVPTLFLTLTGLYLVWVR